jgi:S-DNA-T family DNA segregation ATPase FtsK/SpoIIIE
MSSQIIGRVLARRIKEELARSTVAGGPKLVVTNFRDVEVAAALTELDGLVLEGANGPAALVADVGPTDTAVPDEFRLKSDRSLTWHRNNSRDGLVLFTLAEASDRQGLGQLYRLTDRSLLERLEGTEIDPASWLIDEAWGHAGPRGLESAPEALGIEAAVVYRGVSRTDPISLRLWTRYLVEVCSELRKRNRAVTVDEVRVELGQRLPALEMFPHVRLFDEPRHVERLLERNRHCAAGRDPKGKQIQEGFLAQRIADVHLAIGEIALDASDAAALRAAMQEFSTTYTSEARRKIDFAYWSLLFDSSVRREGLGAQVRRVFEQREEVEAATTFEDLDIEDGLDEGDAEAAAVLLDAQTASGDALADLLPSVVRRRVERTAVPPSRLEADPLQALLRHLVHADDLPADANLRLGVDASPGPTGAWSLAVLRLLYSRTLLDVAEQSSLGDGRTLAVSRDLATFAWPEQVDSQDEEEEEVVDDPWAPVHLGLWVGDEETPRHRFRWWPEDRDGYAALAASVRGRAIGDGEQLAVDIEECAHRLASVLVDQEAPDASPRPLSGIAGESLEIGARHMSTWASHGITADGLFEYVDDWAALLARVRDELVPTNSPLPVLDDFLDIDTARLASGRAVLLASHPLRLRWLAGHLRKLGTDLLAALSGTFELNAENDQLYFESIGRVSAHRQPPMLVAGADEVLAAAREFGLNEEYVPVAQGRASEAWIGVVDEGAVKSLADTVSSYMAAFPYKLDGLGLLLLVKDGDPRLAERLIREISRVHGGTIVVELHVVAPRAQHQAIALALSEPAIDGDRDAHVLPRLRLTLHDWPESFVPLLDRLAGKIDLALVPNLFGAQTQLQPKTRPRTTSTAGHFNPWLDPASHAAPVAGGSGENVSRILLPATPDPLFEAWSTLSVRRYLQSAVAPETPENTDYFTLQVTFDRNRTLFERLHDVAHWVVTLDPFVGRDQIDALESPPDVILVRTGLGKNKTHTLVVSSRSGRTFVVRGLKRRLGSTLGFATDPECTALAERLYDLARNTVPGITLRALGLGRGIEEILGLTVTRFAVEEHFPAGDVGDGFEWWLSLDDHLSWFGGAHRLRADLLRVIARLEDEALDLQLEVVESKFRRQEDLGIADRQLGRSIALLKSALAPPSAATEASDAVFWRRELVAALDETSRRTVLQHDLPALRTFGSRPVDVLHRDVRDRVLVGDYTLSCRGIACALATEASGPSERGLTGGGHALLRMTRDSVLAVLDDIAAERDPSPVAAAASTSGAESVGPDIESMEAPRAGCVRERIAHEETDAYPASAAEGPPGLGAGELEGRYQRLLDAFHEFRVSVGVPDGLHVDEGPGFYLARVVPGPGVTADKLMGRTTDLKLRLGLPHTLDIRTYADRGAVVFEVPKLDEERYDVDAEILWERTSVPESELAVPIGEDIGGRAVVVNFSSSDSPHLLVAGTTGSGKSVALETILRGLCRAKTAQSLRLHLIDPKGTELVGFEDDDHLEGPIGIDASDAIAELSRAVDEMQRRYEAFKPLRVRDLQTYNNAVPSGDRVPWRLIVLDEYADLTADPDEKKQLEVLLRRLAQKARAAGLHIVVATQRPSADVISPVVRANLPAQLALRVRTGTDSRVILDESGAEALAGRGDALLRTARGIVRLQCARVVE